MNKYIPYLFGALLLTAVVILFVTDSNDKKRRLDEKITLRRQDKIPYGTYVAYRNLKYLFPKATVYTNKYEPGYWDSLSVYESNQAFISICQNFNPDEDEMKRLIRFVENGNDVFISARYISYYAEQMLVGSEDGDNIRSFYRNFYKGDMADTLTLSLLNPPYRKGYKEYKYPGKRFVGIFGKINNSTTDIIGTDEDGAPYFIRLKAGKGNFYVHLAPLAFSNYFILHKDNIGYYEKAMSVMNADVSKIVWDEYYLNKREDRFNTDNEKKKGWLNVFMRYPGLKAALLTAIFTLLLFVLLGMRRRQRYIPVMTKPKNDSLDFVKTIGRLYYDRGDHKNLCRKMAAYFLEHVRNRYKLPTGTLDENFISQLRFKSGADEPEIRGIVSFIKYIDDAPAINNNDLTDFHKQLESFYKKA